MSVSMTNEESMEHKYEEETYCTPFQRVFKLLRSIMPDPEMLS